MVKRKERKSKATETSERGNSSDDNEQYKAHEKTKTKKE
jgi:hypothetical protein